AARGLVAPGPIESDDQPTIEFLAPRMTRMNAAGDKDWFTGDQLLVFAQALAARSPAQDGAGDAARRAGLALARYALAAPRALRPRPRPRRAPRGGALGGGGAQARAGRRRRGGGPAGARRCPPRTRRVARPGSARPRRSGRAGTPAAISRPRAGRPMTTS